MRVVVVATDAQGRSCVAEVIERHGAPAEEEAHPIFDGLLRRDRVDRDDREHIDLSPGPGAAMWRIYEFPPGLTYDPHRTSTIDFDVVVDGSMTLVLDTDEVELRPGDAVLLRGDRHGWRAGKEGCRMMFALIDAPAPGPAVSP